ncbi:MAG TPA: aldo/keto reductase [Trueperaceae bacterium]
MIHHVIEGTRVPALGFGTFRMAGEECRAGVADALAIGYRHIDTAQGYDNEKQVGEALARSGVEREEIFLVTKLRPRNFRESDALSSTEESLSKLRTDYVDLLLLHWPNPEVPLAETLDALRKLQETGRVRHIGVSNFPSKLVREAQEHVDVFANQVEYHPYLSQKALLELSAELGYLLTAYSPIAKGKVSEDDTLRAIGKEHGKSPVQVTLRWLIQQQRVAAIPKASSDEHRRSNFDIFDFELSASEMMRISSLGSPDGRLVNPEGAPDWDAD